MVRHDALGTSPFARSRKLQQLVAAGQVTLGGNRRLKIYGTLACTSGQRMQVANRVFFAGEAEALAHGYRPCGHCLRDHYRSWKALQAESGHKDRHR